MAEAAQKRPLIWIMAGESSGDLYGARIAKELKKLNPDCDIKGMGGAKMKAAGVDILVDSTELGVVGIVEVLGIIFTFIRIMLFLTKEAAKQRPDVVLMVDYPGFNIRFAKRCWKMGSRWCGTSARRCGSGASPTFPSMRNIVKKCW